MIEKERIQLNACLKDKIIISADNEVAEMMHDSAFTEHFTDRDLIDRITDFCAKHAVDLQELFYSREYYYLSCFVNDPALFKSVFKDEPALSSLFAYPADVYTISFPWVTTPAAESLVFPERVPPVAENQKHIASMLSWDDSCVYLP